MRTSRIKIKIITSVGRFRKRHLDKRDRRSVAWLGPPLMRLLLLKEKKRKKYDEAFFIRRRLKEPKQQP